MNINWPRWIKASVRKHIKAILGECTLIVEGQERKEDEPLTRYELRIDGPDIDEVSQDEYTIHVYINILVMTEKSSTNLYTHEDAIGLASSSLTGAIPVNRYGDDSVQIGCLEKQTPLIVERFDTLKPQNVDCSTVEAEYKLSLSEV